MYSKVTENFPHVARVYLYSIYVRRKRKKCVCTTFYISDTAATGSYLPYQLVFKIIRFVYYVSQEF